MSTSFRDLFAACEQSITMLRQLLTDGNPSDHQPQTAQELAPLLALLGDFADDQEIDEGPLCDVRARLCKPPATWGDDDFAAAVTAAITRVERIRTAIHVEGHRRLRAAMLGI